MAQGRAQPEGIMDGSMDGCYGDPDILKVFVLKELAHEVNVAMRKREFYIGYCRAIIIVCVKIQVSPSLSEAFLMY